MKIVDIKTKIIPSNPRSKNYPIGYPGGIASNSNGVTPDLSIYLLKEIWERNFEERTDEYGNEYLYIRKPLAIGGGATMYASNGVVVPSIFDGLPLDNTTIRKNPETGLIEVIGGTGTSFDENAMWSALSGSSDNQINKSHLTTALDGYATQNWVIENYATKSELSAVSNKLNDFLEGSDTDTIINKWKELEAFLSGMAETDNLAEILETKADKKYVDSTFVTLGTKQTITGEKTFSSVLNTAAIKASGAITAPSLAASDWVTIAGIKLRKLEDGALMLEGNLALTGALTMYASNGQSFDTIYDGLPIDNDTIYWQEVDGSKVLKAKEGSGSSFDKSAMWVALEGATTEQINKTHLTTALNGYATESWVTSKNYLTSVSIATISDLHANWDALLKAAPSAYVTRWPTISEVTDRKNLIIKLNGGSTEGTNLFTYNVTGEKTINITPAGIGAAASSHNHSWSNITSGKPSTLSGYGITDAYTKTESDNKYPTKTGSGASGTWGISITGNAGSSTKLQTAQKIWGQLFDGTKPVTGALTSVTDITGTGTFTGANLKATDSVYVNGIRLHKTSDGVITLEGNLAVTGGVTMYAIDPVSASTIMDGVVVDGTTIKKENGKLVAVGGGEAGSVAWGNISGKPSVFATNIANITDLHSSWDSVLAAQKPAWLTAVSIATISDLNSGWDALLKAAPSAYVTRWPSFAEVTSKPTTLAGYGITDAPTKTGSGASGTWGINISGTASNADKLDNYHETDFFRARDYISYSILENFVSRKSGTYNVGYGGYSGLLTVFYFGAGSTSAMEILAPYYDPSRGLQLRYAVDDNRFTSWRSFAFEDGNIASATKLQTTRKLWGRPFDGTDDVIGDMTINGNISGVGYINGGFRVDYEDDKVGLRWAGVHTVEFGGNTGYAHTMYLFRPSYSSNGFTEASLVVQNASASNSPTFTTTHGFHATGVGYHSYALGVGREAPANGYAGGVYANTVLTNDWFRSEGNTGWYNQTYGGGWYMFDANFIRSYGEKSVYIGNGCYRNAGGAAYYNNLENISEPYNCRYMSETAYIPTGYIHPFCGWSDLAAGGWTTSYVIGSIRNYANNWGEMYFGIYQYEGASRNWQMYVALDGANRHLYIGGNLMVTGGGTFYGSDIRYKSIIQQIKLSLLDIAKAPSFIYHWNKKEMICDRLNIGGSAQYTQSILPWAVEEKNDLLTMDYATVAYTFSVHTARHLLTYETRTDKKIKKLEREIVILKKQLKKLGYEEASIVDDQSV